MAEQVQVEVSGELLREIHDAVDSGMYASSSEVALEALRAWRERRDDVELDLPAIMKAWDEAVANDRPGLDPEEVFARLRARYADDDGQIS